MAATIVLACVGATFAGEIAGGHDVGARTKAPRRVAFDASGLRPSSNARVLPENSALEEIKEVQALRAVAEDGSARAQFKLGLRYEIGQGVTKDTAAAITWFRLAADEGFDEAEYTLGCYYNDGGLPKDSREAVKWWERAAAQGHADAQFCLGLSYSTGEGVAKDPAAAASWWKRAAEQDHATAEYFLGLCYSVGLGVPKDSRQAVYWLRKSAATGNNDALAALKKIGEDSDLPARKQSADRIVPGRAGSPVTG